jgi:hypothetical protein
MFNCKIYHDYDTPIILLDINVKNLKELATELGMSYQAVADLNSRPNPKKYLQFKYCPKIEITRYTNRLVEI